MAETGTLVVRVYVSSAQLPVQGALVIVSKPDEAGKQQLVSINLTDRNGRIPVVTLDAPSKAESIVPGNKEGSFSTYTMVVEHPDYQLALFEQLQIFPGIQTDQEVALIPLSANKSDKTDVTQVTPQPL